MKSLLWILTLLCGFSATSIFAEDSIHKVTKPQEVTTELAKSGAIPLEIEGLQWNRWTSKNFIVCAINDAQAQYLNKHLELVKGWCFARWGIYDIDFSVECKIIGVDDPALFKKLFNLDASRVEIRRDSSGKIKETIIFLLLNDKPSKVVPIPLMQICLAEFSQRNTVRFPAWSQSGMRYLNGTIDQIRERAIEIKDPLDHNDPMFFSKGLMEMDAEGYIRLDDAKKRLFDNCSMLMCLMVRKEFGQDNYLKLMKMASEGNPETALQIVLKFDGYAKFDKAFKRFMVDLTADIVAGKAPDHYLQIRERHD